mmetsp:Transcript_10455/g.25742  ORF Transcript_10455/g.25742 Transcript_10455/m.25742 type:complete len:212 (+) Transcript_10455:23-658(+)
MRPCPTRLARSSGIARTRGKIGDAKRFQRSYSAVAPSPSSATSSTLFLPSSSEFLPSSAFLSPSSPSFGRLMRCCSMCFFSSSNASGSSTFIRVISAPNSSKSISWGFSSGGGGCAPGATYRPLATCFMLSMISFGSRLASFNAFSAASLARRASSSSSPRRAPDRKPVSFFLAAFSAPFSARLILASSASRSAAAPPFSRASSISLRAFS